MPASLNNNALREEAKILNEKIKQLAKYDSKFGTKIVPNLRQSFKTVDDAFTSSFNTFSVSGSGLDSVINQDIENVNQIYRDLIQKIDSQKSGCGLDNDGMSFNREIDSIKKSFIKTITSPGFDSTPKAKKSHRKSKRGVSKFGYNDYGGGNDSSSSDDDVSGHGLSNLSLGPRGSRLSSLSRPLHTARHHLSELDCFEKKKRKAASKSKSKSKSKTRKPSKAKKASKTRTASKSKSKKRSGSKSKSKLSLML